VGRLVRAAALRRRGRWLMVAVALTAAACAVPPTYFPTREAAVPGGHDATTGAALDSVVGPLVGSGSLSGSVVVIRRGVVVAERAFGFADAVERKPFRLQTPVDGASLAKPFTALLVLKLAREGQIDLNAPVVRYVEEYPHRETRIVELLHHAAGLPDYDAFEVLFRAGEPVTTSMMLRELARRGWMPAFAPGTRFEYCNLCLDTLAVAAERVTGQSYVSLVKIEIAEPAGIARLFVRPAHLRDLPDDRARGYRMREGTVEANDVDDLESFYGGSNLYGSALAFARFASAFAVRSPWLAKDRDEALAEATLRDGTRLPLTLGGWSCDASRARCAYTGDHKAFHHVMMWDAEREVAVALVTTSTVPMALLSRLRRAVIAASSGKPAAPPEAPALRVLDDAARIALAGEYDVPSVGRVRIRLEGGEVWLDVPRVIPQRLFQVTRSIYYAPGADASIGITTDGRLWWSGLFVDAYAGRT